MSKQVLREDPTGYPDWTLPVSIIAQLIETLKVDISAQSLSQLNINIAAVSEAVTFNVEVQNAYLYVRTEAGQNLTVDIAAQSLSALNINIAGSTTTLEVTNPEGQNLNVAVQDSITLNVQITGSSITLPVHEQGTANVAIQSSVTLDVNISGSSISVPVTNPEGESLNVNITGSTTLDVSIVGSTVNVPISIQEPLDASGNVKMAIQSSVTLDVNITGSTTTLEVINPSGQSLDVAITSSTTLNVQIVGSSVNVPISVQEPLDASGNVNVAIQASTTLNVNITGSTTTLEVTNPAGQNLNVAIQDSITINMNIAGSTITVPVETPEGSKVDVNIIQSITLNVNITGSDVTLNVNIASASVAINIKTESGANIVIDKLTTSAYTETRRTISNHGDSASWLSVGTTYYRGKFFPRGCRGLIGYIEVYAYNPDSADHTLTIYLSPNPGMAAIYSKTITVSAGGGPSWFSAYLGKYWNYDSLFIYVIADHATYPYIGYDSGSPPDYVYSSDLQEWWYEARRLWIRVQLLEQTVGDLPVTGTINAVQIPNVAARKESGYLGVPAGEEVTAVSVDGAGEMTCLQWYVSNSSVYIKVYCDENLVFQMSPFEMSSAGYSDCTPRISLTLYNAGGACNGIISIPFAFRRRLVVAFYNNTTSDQTVEARVNFNLIS